MACVINLKFVFVKMFCIPILLMILNIRRFILTTPFFICNIH